MLTRRDAVTDVSIRRHISSDFVVLFIQMRQRLNEIGRYLQFSSQHERVLSESTEWLS